MVMSDIWLQCQLQERILETIQQNVGSSHYHTLSQQGWKVCFYEKLVQESIQFILYSIIVLFLEGSIFV